MTQADGYCDEALVVEALLDGEGEQYLCTHDYKGKAQKRAVLRRIVARAQLAGAQAAQI